MANERFLGRWSRMKRDASHGPASSQPDPGSDQVSPGEGGADGSSSAGSIGAGHGGEGRPGEGRSAEAIDARIPGSANALAAAAAPSAAPLSNAPGGSAPSDGPADPAAGPTERLPSLDTLTGDSDFSAFMQSHVDPAVRVSALKKLFADPRFNRMDGLDVYIDDYGKPDPIEPAFLKRLNQARTLNLVPDEEPEVAGTATRESGTAGSDTASAATEGSAGTEDRGSADAAGSIDAAGSANAASGPDTTGETDTTDRTDTIGDTKG